MPSEIKLAFVGCGGIAPSHLSGIKEMCPRIRITACVDPVVERAEAIAAEAGGAEVFASFDEALDRGDFDAVDLMLPHDLHEPFAIQSLQAGKHILLEKPIAHSLEAADRILDAAARADTIFMIAENAQYVPEVVTVRKLIHDGCIGEVITARANFSAQHDDFWYTEREPWRCDNARAGGGAVIDGGAHWIRPLRMWMGEIDEVVGTLDYPVGHVEGESLARALIRFRSGRIGAFDAIVHPGVKGADYWWLVSGSKGEILVDAHFARGVMLFTDEHPDGLQVMAKQGFEKSYGSELLDFSRAILEGKELKATAEYAMGELRTARALYRSAETRQWEKVWD